MNPSPLPKPRVLLADDSERFLKVVSRILQEEFDVVGSAVNGEQAIEAALRLRPDVLVLDILMPVMDGIHTARWLKKLDISTKIVFLTGLEDSACLNAAMQAGGDGFVFKVQLPTDLPRALRAVLAGETFLSCMPHKNERDS
jgi:DNA-binding NarL/FixJ family response regulator